MKERKKEAHECVCVWEVEKMKLEEACVCVSLCLRVIAEKALLGEKKKAGGTVNKNEKRKRECVCPWESV